MLSDGNEPDSPPTVEEDGKEAPPSTTPLQPAAALLSWATVAVGILCVVLLVLVVVGLSATSFASNDFPALVKYGDFFLENGRFARFSDVAVARDADRTGAFHHQWLTEAILSLAWGAFGGGGVWAVKMVVLLSVVVFLYLAGSRKVPLWVFGAVACAVLLSTVPRILLRGDFLSLAMMAGFLWLLEKTRSDGQWKRLYVLVPCQAFWMNLHPLGIFGLFLTGLCLSEALLWPWLVDREGLREILARRKHALLAGAGTVLGACITPQGPMVLIATIGIGFESDEAWMRIRDTIAEFSPTGAFFESEYLLVLKVFLVVVSAVLLAWLVTRAARPWLVVAHAVMAVFAVLHIRMVGFAAVTAGFALVASLPPIADWARKRLAAQWSRARLWALLPAVLAALWLASTAWDLLDDSLFIRNADVRRFGVVKANHHFPWKAMDFLREKGIGGNCFNNFDVGSFLLWQLPAGSRPFIDTQFHYSVDFYFQYGRIMNGTEPLWGVLDRYAIDFVVLKHASPESVRVFASLYEKEEWKLVYMDECGVVFVRAGTENWRRAGEREIRVEKSRPESLLSQGEDTSSRSMIMLADFLVRLGLLPKAEYLYARALEQDPRHFTAWHNLGIIFARRGDHGKALKYLLVAIEKGPRFEKARETLADLLASGKLDPGDPEVRRARDLVD